MRFQQIDEGFDRSRRMADGMYDTGGFAAHTNRLVMTLISIWTICVAEQRRVESWKARARERQGSAQALAVGITARGWTRRWPLSYRLLPALGLGSWLGYVD